MVDLTRDRIYDHIVKTIAEISGHAPADLSGRTELIMDLGLDSLAIFEVVIELEETFALQISDEDADRIKSIDDAVNYIARQLTAGK